MGSLFQDDGQPGRFESSAMLELKPQDFRERAAQCRELAETCLTQEAQQVLSDLADELNREASELEAMERRR